MFVQPLAYAPIYVRGDRNLIPTGWWSKGEYGGGQSGRQAHKRIPESACSLAIPGTAGCPMAQPKLHYDEGGWSVASFIVFCAKASLV